MSGPVDHDGTEQGFLSIGEVLDLLKLEFPDVTISKIRFLESQGLLDPERTPSGYRKFYEGDVERLRWILNEQRENFLPLKVIKGRLESEGKGAAPAAAPAEDATTGSPESTDPEPRPVRPRSSAAPPAAASPARPSARVTGGGATARAAAGEGPGLGAPSGGAAPTTAAPSLEGSPASFTAEELAAATGLSLARLAELQRYGLLVGHSVAGQTYFDSDGLVVARLSAGFSNHGVETRHLRMFKTAAEREAGFYEQVVLPLLKQRNPVARRHAVETLGDLAQLGEALRATLVRQALRPYTEGT